MSLRSLIALFLLTSIPAFPQKGDKPGDAQAELPKHLKTPPAPTLAPDDAIKTLKLAPGFKAELAAADPLVGDPVAMTIGPDGRIWVVEMRGFMRNADGKGESDKIGTISVL